MTYEELEKQMQEEEDWDAMIFMLVLAIGFSLSGVIGGLITILQ